MTDAIYEAGFGSSSRGYEGAGLGMTPARFAAGGRGEQIGYTTARSPFGWLVVGATGRGLCWLALGATSADAEGVCARSFRWPHCGATRRLRGLVDAAVGQVARAVPGAGQGWPWICAGRRFNCGCGRRCGRSREERRGAIANWRGSWATRRQRGRWLGLALPIVWRWWCLAIVWWGQAERYRVSVGHGTEADAVGRGARQRLTAG